MNIVIFDTETIGLNKPFCYNIGYVISDENGKTLLEREFIVEQIWHNTALFSTAYYAEKRPIYVKRMKSRKVIMNKFGYICQQMIRDFKAYEVTRAFAFNSDFDERVFNFNCDWFKCVNPFDNIEIADIRGYVHHFIINEDYKQFCELNSLFTDSGNYATTAESVYKYLFDYEFTEEHTALADSQIEAEILFKCIAKGAEFFGNYKSFRSIERKIIKTLHIRTAEQTDYYFDYEKIRINENRTEIKLK